ncbi:MAG: hypothetical protein CXT67_04275 [Methanobacteriota archaeon]|nr:MAG: hypothetical protein CXT67_04275 [Euryarchaeota archaeon]
MRFQTTQFSAQSVVQGKICQMQVGVLSELLLLKQFSLLIRMKLVLNPHPKRWMLILLIVLHSK